MPHSLTPSQRERLERIDRTAFANPFSEDRRVSDLAITGMDDQAPADALLAATVAETRRLLEEIRQADPKSLGVRERELIRTAHLFDIFHLFLDRFDLLIRRQVDDPQVNAPVPFAREALDLLAGRGIAPREAVRFLAMFFQLRRAYYFIDRSLVGPSPCMQRLRLSLWNNVFTHDVRLYERHMWNRMEDFSTLILGATGTGKGAAAMAIGRSGFIPYLENHGTFAESFMQSFRSLNLSQYPESLLESELFGHRKGAFTGATESHEGAFSRCSPHGAIFLDEIGDASIPVQIKLLRVLQERTFTPVGSHDVKRFQGRVIAATNKPIETLRGEGLFRDDFFYRLSSDVIEVPTLRQRIRENPDELNALLAIVMRRLVGSDAPELVALVSGVIARDLEPDYAWPGNVRELEQCARRALLTCAYTGDRRPAAQTRLERLVAAVDAGDCDMQALTATYCALLYERHGTYEEVARRTGLDRRTAKKYVLLDTGQASPHP